MSKFKKSKKDTYKWVDDFFNCPMTSEQERISTRLKEYSNLGNLNLFYAEVEKQVDKAAYPYGRTEVLALIIQAAMICAGKKDLREGLNGTKDLNNLQKNIAKQAENLATLLDKRDKLINPRSKTSKATITPIELYVAAGTTMCPAGRRIGFKKDTLPALKGYYNLKSNYTLHEPTLMEILRALSSQMKENPIGPAHYIEKKAHQYRKTAPAADFVRCFLQGINASVFIGSLPQSFSLSATAVATVTEAALGIEGGVTERAVQLAATRSK